MPNLVEPLPIVLEPGLKLVPQVAGRVGNAIITEKQNDLFVVVTDFGNEIKLSESELRNMFESRSNQDEIDAIYEDVWDETLTPRRKIFNHFMQQKRLLDAQLEKLEKSA